MKKPWMLGPMGPDEEKRKEATSVDGRALLGGDTQSQASEPRASDTREMSMIPTVVMVPWVYNMLKLHIVHYKHFQSLMCNLDLNKSVKNNISAELRDSGKVMKLSGPRFPHV